MASIRLIVGLLLLGGGSLARAQSYVITTNAGGGPPATPAAALHMWFGTPWGLASDKAGNLFFTSLNCLFKMDTTGIVTRLAGTSRPGYSGDNGLAVNAELYRPTSVAIDQEGNVFLADTGNNRIRRVSPDGIIVTVAGNGSYGYSGDGGPATDAQLGYGDGFYSWAPAEIAVDTIGNLFILDSSRIRKVSTDGVISTYVENVFGPIAVDAAGNLFAVGANNSVIRIFPDGTITPVAGGPKPSGSTVFTGLSNFACVDDLSGDGGPATQTGLCPAISLAVDAMGNLFISEYWLDDPAGDYYNAAVRKVSPDGTITTVAGGTSFDPYYEGGPATAFQIFGGELAVDAAGNLFMTDDSSIRKVSRDGTIVTVAGSVFSPTGDPVWFAQRNSAGDGGLAASSHLERPCSVAVDQTGNLFIGDCSASRVRKVSPDGTITTVAGGGIPGIPGSFVEGALATESNIGSPDGLAVDWAGNLYIAGQSSNCVRKVSPAGIITTVAGNGTAGYSGNGGPAVKAQLNYPTGVAVDMDGNLYIADGANSRVRKVSAGGIITTAAGNGINGFSGDGGPATKAEIQGPSGVATDNAGNVYIAGGRVRKVSRDGIITTVAGNGRLSLGDGGPAIDAATLASWVAVDAAGNLFITSGDYGARVRKISTDGIINTVAGQSLGGYSGDGGPAVDALLSNPRGVAVDLHGNVFVADANNGVVRVLRPIE